MTETMRSLRLALLGLVLSILSVIGLLIWTAPDDAPDEPEPEHAALPEEIPDISRNVTPPRALPGPSVSGPLTRLPAREPPPPPPKPPKPALIHRVSVIDAGTVRYKSGRIRFAHIAAPVITDQCDDPEGRSWPCGQAAATELKMLIRRRAIACGLPIPGEYAEGAEVRHCRLGNLDVGEWLVRQGWALPKDGAPEAYRNAAESARDGKRGRFGTAWGH